MASRREQYEVELRATDNASATIEQVANARDKLSDDPVVVDITADDEASETIEEVTEATEDLNGAEAEVELGADDEATEVVEGVAEGVEDLDGTDATVGLAAEDEATDAIEGVGEALDGVDGDSASVTVTVDGDSADDVTAVSDALDEIDGDEASVTVTVDGDDDSDVTAVGDAITDIDGDEATVTVTVDGDDSSDVTEVSDALEELEGDEATATVTVDGDTEDDVTGVSDAITELDGDSATATLSVDGASDAESDISSITDNLALLGVGSALVTGAAAGLAAVFSGAADHVLSVQGMAEATGSTLRDASGLDEAFDFVGVSASRVLTMIGRVNDKLNESPELAEALGITVEDKAPLDLFVDAVDALNAGQLTANDRLSIAVDLFGRKGAQSVFAVGTQVGDLSDAIENIPEWQVITNSDVESAIRFKQTMDELGDLAAEAGQQFLTAFGPGIRDFFQFLEDTGARVNSVFQLGMEGSTRSVFDFMQSLDSASFVAINDAYLELGGTVESLRENYFHLSEVQALLDLGVPPEVIASSKLTGEAVQFLGEQMADSAETATRLRDALDDGRLSNDQWRQVAADGVITMEELDAALGETSEAFTETDERARAFAEAQNAAEAESAALEAELKGQVEQLEATAEAHRDTAKAIQDAADGYLDEREAVRDAEDALDDYHEAMQPVEDDTRTAAQVTRDQERALDNVVTSYDDAADAAVEQARRVRESEGATLSETEALDIKNQSLLDVAATLNGPERDAILEHIARINGIPEERITEILTDTDPDDIAQVEAEINHASRTRKSLVQADVDEYAAAVAEQAINNIARTRYAKVYVDAIQRSGFNFFQHGTPHAPAGLAIVGEAGPELVELPEGSLVHTAEKSAEILRRRAPAATIYNDYTVVHMPAGTTVRDLRRYKRRNGQVEGVA